MNAVRDIVATALAVAALGGCATVAVPRAPAPAAAPAPLAAAAPAPTAAARGLLRNADFEADPVAGRACPPSWWCTMHNDPDSFRFALATDPRTPGRFLKVSRVKPEPWALVTQAVPATGLVGKRLRVSVTVNAEELDGGAGPMIILQGPGGRVLGDRKALQSRAPGWREARVEIDIPAGTELVEIGLVMEGGGWVGFDDVAASVHAPAGS